MSPGPERLARAVPIGLGLDGSPGEHGGDPTPAGGASKNHDEQISTKQLSGQRATAPWRHWLQPATLQDEGLQDALLFIFSKETPPATLHYLEKKNIFYFFYLNEALQGHFLTKNEMQPILQPFILKGCRLQPVPPTKRCDLPVRLPR